MRLAFYALAASLLLLIVPVVSEAGCEGGRCRVLRVPVRAEVRIEREVKRERHVVRHHKLRVFARRGFLFRRNRY